ncbi:MAG: hypothetical protein PHO03_01730 [Candidatus Omnitrophica bacterium]|nr:hypothetical protein [Candidatus Omnitrophota bacterium]
MLKLVVEKIEDVEEKYRDLYKRADDGKFHLDAEADPESKKKVDEFRENNVKLMKEKEDLQKKIDSYGADPEKVKEWQKKVQAIEDKQMIEAGKIDELVEQKVQRMRQEYENQIKALQDAVDIKNQEVSKTNNRLSEVLIDSEITKAVAGKVRAGAMADILSRGRRVWHLDENGQPVPKENDKILYGKDGKQQMTFEEWAIVQMEVAPFLFEPSAGGGSNDGRGGAAGKGAIDYSKIPASERLKMIHGEVKAT